MYDYHHALSSIAKILTKKSGAAFLTTERSTITVFLKGIGWIFVNFHSRCITGDIIFAIYIHKTVIKYNICQIHSYKKRIAKKTQWLYYFASCKTVVYPNCHLVNHVNLSFKCLVKNTWNIEKISIFCTASVNPGLEMLPFMHLRF